MAKPPHRVGLQKDESVATGGSAADSDDMLYTALEPHEDAVNVGGVALQQPSGPPPGHSNDALVMIWRELGEMLFCDTPNAAGVTLTQLLAGALPPATAVGQVLFSRNGTTFTVEQPIVSVDGWIANFDDELLVEGL